jgi:glycosyltransferase involved in cell wall biosynthesis
MRIAAHGYISDSGGSSAGAFRGLLATLLEAGHEVDFYGIPNFTEPKSLGRFPAYRFEVLKVHWITRGNRLVRRLRRQYPAALHSTLSQAGYQREAIRRMEASPRGYDVILCLDTLNLWPSRLPVVSWPQSPPHTEWAALRRPELARRVIRSQGLLYYSMVQGFYGYRWLQARLAIPTSDVILSASAWAYRHWLDFGLPEQRLVLQPYPIEIAGFEHVPHVSPGDGHPETFLWLGRAVPRKRLDLFLAAFDLVRQRRPGVRAHIVGNMDSEPAAKALLRERSGDPGILHTPGVPRAEVPGVFRDADVLVQPSQNENFGFAVAEALAAGRPVVTGRTNGTGSWGDSATFWFEDYTPAAVADAMERALIAVRSEPDGLGQRARAAARAHFEPHTVARRVCEVAEMAIERRRARRSA